MAMSEKVFISLRPDGQKGLFAKTQIDEGEILVRYDGPIIAHPTRHSIQIDDCRHIEGTPESNAFLNHGCDPNACVDWTGICLRALRNITAGEEVTCNYLTTDWELHESFTCHCGAANCYGELKGLKYLSPAEQRRLALYLPGFLKRRISGQI